MQIDYFFLDIIQKITKTNLICNKLRIITVMVVPYKKFLALPLGIGLIYMSSSKYEPNRNLTHLLKLLRHINWNRLGRLSNVQRGAHWPDQPEHGQVGFNLITAWTQSWRVSKKLLSNAVPQKQSPWRVQTKDRYNVW